MKLNTLISQVEYLYGRQPQTYVLQLVNDCLDMISVISRMYKKNEKIPSRTSPKNDKRACLCPDGTYSRKCCDGSLLAQGVGNVN